MLFLYTLYYKMIFFFLAHKGQKNCFVKEIITIIGFIVFPSSQQIFHQYQGASFGLLETRRVTIGNNFPGCGLDLQNNYKGDGGIGFSIKYYVKKRVSDDGRYQMIASRRPLVNPNDPFHLADPNPISPDRPDEFPYQLGWIFCSYSVLTPPEIFVQAAHNCGIEQTLVEICMQDRDVIDQVELNLRRIFRRNHPIPSVANTAEAMWTLVRNNCNMVLQVNFRGRRVDAAREVLRGARRAGFTMAVMITNTECQYGGVSRWEHYQTDVLLDERNNDLLQRLHTVIRYDEGYFKWYFCR